MRTKVEDSMQDKQVTKEIKSYTVERAFTYNLPENCWFLIKGYLPLEDSVKEIEDF